MNAYSKSKAYTAQLYEVCAQSAGCYECMLEEQGAVSKWQSAVAGEKKEKWGPWPKTSLYLFKL